MNKIGKNKGITLVALVVTIIILLILTGITISQLTGSGLFTKAQQAATETKYANAAEKVALAVNASYDITGKINDNLLKENVNKIDGLDKKVEQVTYDLKIIVDGFEFTISEYGKITGEKTEVATLPENTKDTNEGTEVKLPSEWGTQAVSYIKTTDGTEVTTLETVATVYAVSVGNGETVPIPKDFYYVGGTLDTGVIISDNSTDKYEKGKDKTTYVYTTQLQGNQFVWIPCTTSEYHKSNTWNNSTQTNSNLASAWWDTTTSASELTQIEKYGGFYVARYEAGLASTISEFTETQINGITTQIYNKDGKPQSKAGVVPWMFVDWTHSKANAESMYKNEYVNSRLITGTQWDVVLNKMVEKTNLTAADLTNSGNWGNYNNNSISYNGRLAKATYDSSWYLAPFGTNTTGTTTNYGGNKGGDLLTTGASSTTEKYHIFDIAGNLSEWTEEISFYGGNTSTQYRVIRGGNYPYASDTYPACYRYGNATVNNVPFTTGFRAVLYIK